MSDVNLNRRILAVSAATLRWHIDAGLRPDIANILANGVDLQRFAPGRNSHDLLDELGLDHSCKIVGNVGQIGLRKAQDMANLLDTAVKLPIIPIRVGLDSLIGLIPGAGDALMLGASFRIIWLAKRMGVPKALLTKMVKNLGYRLRIRLCSSDWGHCGCILQSKSEKRSDSGKMVGERKQSQRRYCHSGKAAAMGVAT